MRVGNNLGPELAAKLRALIVARPGARAGELIAAFRAETGERVGPTTITRQRAMAGVPRAVAPHQLTPELAATLDRMIAGAGPGPTFARIAADFAKATGRTVGPVAVRNRAMRLGITRPSSGAGPRAAGSGRQLTEGQATLLDGLILEAGPRTTFGRMASDFEAATGRKVTKCTVIRRAHRLGITRPRGPSSCW